MTEQIKRKQTNKHVREHLQTIDEDIFSCYARQEAFFCKAPFRYCPSCGVKIDE